MDNPRIFRAMDDNGYRVVNSNIIQNGWNYSRCFA